MTSAQEFGLCSSFSMSFFRASSLVNPAIAQFSEALIQKFGRSTAESEIRWMRAAFNNRQSLLYTRDEQERDVKLVDALRQRVNTSKPLQYIIGTQPFGEIEIKCRPPVLIPRPETENWVLELASRFAPTPQHRLRVLDLGTGSGCIPLLLAKMWPPGSMWAHGVDINPEAVCVSLLPPSANLMN